MLLVIFLCCLLEKLLELHKEKLLKRFHNMCSSWTFPPVIEISFTICCVTRRKLHASSLSGGKLLSALLRSQDISFYEEGGPHQRPTVFT